MTAEPVLISHSALAAVLRCCGSAIPFEGCGILAGRPEFVARAICLPNSRAGPYGFRIGEEDLAGALERIHRAGLRWVGVFHSHPTGTPRPSLADLQGAPAGVPWMLIVSLAGGRPRLSLYAVRDGRARPRPWRAIPDPP